MARCRLLALLWCVVIAACFERGGGQGGSKPVDDAAQAPPTIPASAIAGPDDPAGTPDAAATIRIALEAEPAHLNPIAAADAITQRIVQGDVYEGLLCRHGDTAPATPCLAEKVTETDNGRRWTFRLRAGVTWHDGTPFSAADVRFTFELLRAGKIASWLTSEVGDLDAVKVMEGGRVVELAFRTSRPGRRGALARIPIVPRHLWHAVTPSAFVRAPHSRRPIGTGPLRVSAWQSGESITLERWTGYWGRPARAARIVYRVVPDRQRAQNLLAAGDLDVAVQLPIDDALRSAARYSHLHAFSYATPAYLAAVHNLRRPPLSDVRTRRALTMLLDRGGVVDELFRGLAHIITGPLLPGGDDLDTAIRPLPFSPAHAAALLTEAGTRGARLELMVPSGSRTMGRIADVWANDAKPVLNLVVVNVPFADMLSRLREGRFDVALMAFTTAPDVDLFGRFHSAEVGVDNYGAVRDPALDALLVAVRQAPSPPLRAVAQRKVHARLHALQPYTFIASDTRAGVARRTIGGLGDSGGAMPRARDLWKQK